MAEISQFNIELDLKPNAPHEKFSSADKFQKWLEKESTFWNWSTEELRQRDSQAFQRLHGFLSKLNHIKDLFNGLQRYSPGTPQYTNQVTQLQNQVLDYYKKGALIHSGDARAKFLKSVAEKDPIHATYILDYFVERKWDRIINNNNNYVHAFEGACAALLFQWNVKGKMEGETTALEELRKDWQEHLKASKDTLATEHEKIQKTLETDNLNAIHHNERFEELITKTTTSADELIAKTQKRFEDIEKWYEEKLALRSAISYWEAKGKSHSKGAVGFAFAVIGTFGLASFLIFLSIKEVVGNATIQTVPLWKLSMLFLIAIMGVWSLRVMIRLLLSNIHLADDAKERRTMLLTYLALLKEGDLPEGEVRHLILQALFRPSSTGIVRDDAAPPFMAEWLKRTTGTD